MAVQAEYQAIKNSLEAINETLQAEDPKSMAPALLGRELINLADSEKLALPTTTDMEAARLISSTVLKKAKPHPNKVFEGFLKFLKDSGQNELVKKINAEHSK